MKITRDAIEGFWAQNAANGCSLERDMLWGYFFTGDPEALMRGAPDLERLGYRVVGLLGPSEEDDDQDTSFLHVERVERHTPDSLERRCWELDDLAIGRKFGELDGFDVGNVDGSVLWT